MRYLESKPNKNKITVYQQKKMWCKLIYQKLSTNKICSEKKVTQKNSMKRRNNQQP